MGRLFITGDTHGDIDIYKLTTKAFPLQKELTKDDTLVILGDAGFCWDGGKQDAYIQRWFNEKTFTTLVVDGNHENHDLIAALPIVEKFGSEVRQVNDSIFYAIRGEVYTINGKKCMCVGGADSHDKALRKEGKSWWEGEQIKEIDVLRAVSYLWNNEDTKIDYLFTHTGGSEVCKQLGFAPTVSDEWLDKILEAARYSKHYLGHYHLDKWIGDSRIVYNDIIEPY